MDFFDNHVHFIWNGSFESASQKWQHLIDQGLKGMGGIIIPYYPREAEKFFKLIPAQYHEKLADTYFIKGPEFEVSTQTIHQKGLQIFPYLDVRFLESYPPDLTGFQKKGFKGLKILYILEDDPDFGIWGWKEFFGRSEKDSERFTLCLVEQAHRFNWPVLFHLDLRRYEVFMREVLQTFPEVPLIIPHFGYSRKIMADLMERFDSCYTDVSSLLPFMKKDPQNYLDFILSFQDRILFGSDSLWDEPHQCTRYLKFITTLISDEAILRKILFENFLRLHGDIKEI